MPQNDIMSAIRQIAAERKIEVDEIVSAIEDSIKAVFLDSHGIEDEDIVTVQMDTDNGGIHVYSSKKVVKKVEDKITEIDLKEAQEISKDAEEGDTLQIDITPEGDFGRIAAQTARQAILQKLRDAEKEAVLRQFKDKVGHIISVVVQRVTMEGDVICEVGKAKALMPKNERIMTEFYKIGSPIKVLLKEIAEDSKGKYMLVSRADEGFLRDLFAMEVPEIESGTVEIVAIARDAGQRSKVAVRSLSQGVDPIGSCVGQKGVRINAISNELRNGNFEEKIEIIPWNEDEQQFLMSSIMPAEALKIEIVDKKRKVAKLFVAQDKLSLAIGREGQNARLASKLTGWDLEIVSDGRVEEAPKQEQVSETESTEE